MPCSDQRALRDWLDDTANSDSAVLNGPDAQVPLGALAQGSSLDVDVARLADQSVLIATRDQLTTALALIELDGVARRLTLLPPDFPRGHVPAIVAKAEIDAAVVSEDTCEGNIAAALKVICRPPIAPV